MTYRVGIDSGSKTIKVVVLDEDDSIVHSVYLRHKSNIKDKLYECLHYIEWQIGEIEAKFAFTGSSGIDIARELGIPFVQEVIATTTAVRNRFPKADVVIELGGEDAKVIYLSDDLEQRMNATCAGGTGGFLDTMSYMLGFRSGSIDSYACGYQKIYPIASRCAVFAQTNVRSLLNTGASKHDIAASVFDAIVRQTIGGLACGRPIRGTVVFLGGPFQYHWYLANSFRKALALDHSTGIKPADAHLYTALGAAYLAGRENGNKTMLLSEVIAKLKSLGEIENDLGRLEPLFTSENEIIEFRQAHEGYGMPRKDIYDTEGSIYLGIDAGSTTVKLAAIDDEANLVYSAYEHVNGDTVGTLRSMLDDLYVSIPKPYGQNQDSAYAWIDHATATGYGEDLLKSAFGVDSGVVETTAHLKSALHLCPDATFVFDIGGQDMKAFWVHDGQINDVVLNEACSSGCGSFIEGTAHALGSTPYSFSDKALLAASPVDLGTKCTVFMTSRVRHAQKIGTSIEDIAAGVAYSVVKNALYRIIGASRVKTMGERIVVQGGTFMSDAVLRAFEKICGLQVIRPKQAHLMGAIGAALIARERAISKAESNHVGLTTDNSSVSSDKPMHANSAHLELGAPKSKLISREQIRNMEIKQSRVKCSGCGNGCLLSVMDFGGGRTHITGNRCPKGEQELERQQPPLKRDTTPDGVDRNTPNVVALEQNLFKSFGDKEGRGKRKNVRVGLINTLDHYSYLPFWHTLFVSLGFSIVMPDTSKDVSNAGKAWETIPSESVCYAAKLSHVRHYNLADKGASVIFMPTFDRGLHCPVSSNYAKTLDINTADNPAMIVPHLASFKPACVKLDEPSKQNLRKAIEKVSMMAGVKLSDEEFEEALKAAYKAQAHTDEIIAHATEKALEWIESDCSRHGIIIAGRPYHNDKSLLRCIDLELTKLGFAVLSMSGMEAFMTFDEEAAPLTSYEWKQGKRLLKVAYYVESHPQVDAVFLQSFGCSYDTVSLEEVRMVLARAGRPFTALKMDDISDTGHIKIRLRTLAEAIESIKRKTDFSLGDTYEQNKACKNEDAYSSDIAPATADALEKAFDASDLDVSRSCVTNDICFSLRALVAHVIRLIEDNPNIEIVKVPYICKDCLIDALPLLVEIATDKTPKYEWVESWNTPHMDMERRLHLADTNTPPLANKATAGNAYESDDSPLKIGIVGNPLMVLDPFMNDDIADLLDRLGCRAVMPDQKALFVDDVRYEDQLDRFSKTDVKDVIYLQSFGCLKGHVQSRGAIQNLKKKYPDVSITVLDYDPEASALNRENRIRLAVEAAREKKIRQEQ